MQTATLVLCLFVVIVMIMMYYYIEALQNYIIDQTVGLLMKVHGRMKESGVESGKVMITAYVPPVFGFSVGV